MKLISLILITFAVLTVAVSPSKMHKLYEMRVERQHRLETNIEHAVSKIRGEKIENVREAQSKISTHSA